MDVCRFRDGFQWHRPLRDIGMGGESPAGPGFMPIRYDRVLARSLPQPTRL
jgi:hypothetical protein